MDNFDNLRKIMDRFPQKNAHTKWHRSFCINFRGSGTFSLLQTLTVLVSISFIQEERKPLAPLCTVLMTTNGPSRLEGLAWMRSWVSGHRRASLLFHYIGLIFILYFNTSSLFSQSFSCLQALPTQKQGQSTTRTCKERNALLPLRGALVSEPWEMDDVTTRSGRVSNGNWKQNSRKPVQQLTPKRFSICEAVLNPQETLRINFVLSFLFA